MHLLKPQPKSDFQKNLFGKSKMLTNRNLYSFHKEIISWKQNATVIELFFEEEIKKFYDNNAKKLDSIISAMKFLDRKYFQHGEDGKMLWQSIKENESIDKQTFTKKPIMNEGFTIEDYNKEFENLMNEPCNVKY